jgi:glycosyltransferase involved in cell wall biosynthesis
MYPHKEKPYDGIFVKEQIDSIKEQCPECNICVFHIKGYESPLNYLKAIFEIRRLLRENEYNLIHAHYGLSGLVSIFQSKVPVICTFHGSDVLYIWWQSLISRVISFFLIQSIAVSKEIAGKLPVNKISVVPCGVNMSFFSQMDKNKAKEKLNLEVKKKYLLFPANPKRKVKNYYLFKETLKLLKKDFVIDEIILNNFNRKEVKYALNAADLILITSYSEASNMVLKEALACNTPVISVNTGDAKEILNRLRGCMVSESKIENLYKAIHKVLRTKETSHYNYREKIKYLSTENTARKIIEIYEKCGRAIPKSKPLNATRIKF